MPRQPNPDLEKRILEAASRLWARGGEKTLTMRAIAKAAGTTTPTVYERYRDRDDILRALRLQTREELYASLSRTRTLREAVQEQLKFALEHRHAYQFLFDGVAKTPSLHEPWPSFNLLRERVAKRLGGNPRQHTRLMLAVWSLIHGTAVLMIRGQFEGSLRIQAVHTCLDAVDAMLESAARHKGLVNSGPRWPASLILGEGRQSRVGNGKGAAKKNHASRNRS
jgi:AcrR family transcriptional regulator